MPKDLREIKKTLGQVAYETYKGSLPYGQDFPSWQGIPENIKDAWEKTAEGVLKEQEKQTILQS